MAKRQQLQPTTLGLCVLGLQLQRTHERRYGRVQLVLVQQASAQGSLRISRLRGGLGGGKCGRQRRLQQASVRATF